MYLPHEPWRRSFRNPRYVISLCATLVVFTFLSAPAYTRWGATAGWVTFFSLTLLLVLAEIKLRYSEMRKHAPRLDDLE
jgi:hypothetical protein